MNLQKRARLGSAAIAAISLIPTVYVFARTEPLIEYGLRRTYQRTIEKFREEMPVPPLLEPKETKQDAGYSISNAERKAEDAGTTAVTVASNKPDGGARRQDAGSDSKKVALPSGPRPHKKPAVKRIAEFGRTDEKSGNNPKEEISTDEFRSIMRLRTGEIKTRFQNAVEGKWGDVPETATSIHITVEYRGNTIYVVDASSVDEHNNTLALGKPLSEAIEKSINGIAIPKGREGERFRYVIKID